MNENTASKLSPVEAETKSEFTRHTAILCSHDTVTVRARLEWIAGPLATNDPLMFSKLVAEAIKMIHEHGSEISNEYKAIIANMQGGRR